MTQPVQDATSAEAHRAGRHRADARAHAGSDDIRGAAGARASASVHVSLPPPGGDGHENLPEVAGHLGRVAASTLVLAGAVLALAVVLALGMACS